MSRTGFLLAEDEAVKLAFSNITVPSDKGGSVAVTVRFADPSKEIEKDLPLITVQGIGINHARNRQHSDQWIYLVNPAIASGEWAGERADIIRYWPDTTDDAATIMAPDVPFERTVELIPVDLIYRIVTYCRHPIQDRVLQGKILSEPYLPFRHGFISVPADGTIRRFDLLGSPQPADIRDQETGYQKMLFRKIYTAMVNAELPAFQLVQTTQVAAVDLSIEYFASS